MGIFIKNVKEWANNNQVQVDYYVTQALTGYGVFGIVVSHTRP